MGVGDEEMVSDGLKKLVADYIRDTKPDVTGAVSDSVGFISFVELARDLPGGGREEIVAPIIMGRKSQGTEGASAYPGHWILLPDGNLHEISFAGNGGLFVNFTSESGDNLAPVNKLRHPQVEVFMGEGRGRPQDVVSTLPGSLTISRYERRGGWENDPDKVQRLRERFVQQAQDHKGRVVARKA